MLTKYYMIKITENLFSTTKTGWSKSMVDLKSFDKLGLYTSWSNPALPFPPTEFPPISKAVHTAPTNL